MPIFKCKCSPKEEHKISNVTIKLIDGAIRHDVQCEKCDEYMELAHPKSGECAGFTSNNIGQL